MSALQIAILTAAVVAIGELFHYWRCRRVALLAFPQGSPRAWTKLVPLTRICAAALLGWGLSTLYFSAPGDLAGKNRELAKKRLVVALDVSPSMDLRDAGPDGSQTRGHRARELIRSLLARADLTGVPVSIVALYNGARPVVVDTIDPEVVENILNDLPLEHAFTAGKTTLYEAIVACGELAKGFSLTPDKRPQPWPNEQARLVIVSDGDTEPPQQSISLPPAFSGVLVVGVGDPTRGLSIAGHLSRQESASLRQLAGRFGGKYHDGNRRHVPSELLAEFFPVRGSYATAGLGEYALIAIIIGSALLALIPVALAAVGGPRPIKSLRSTSYAT